MSGREIAEWAMNNRDTLNLKYVIWGQRIWNPSVDGVKGWTSWRAMEDRGDVTQNHWYVLTPNFDLGVMNISNTRGPGTMSMSVSTKLEGGNAVYVVWTVSRLS